MPNTAAVGAVGRGGGGAGATEGGRQDTKTYQKLGGIAGKGG